MVTVTDVTGSEREWVKADSYDVTENGHLVLYSEGKPFATYPPGAWRTAWMEPEDI